MKKFLGWGVAGFIALALIGSCMDDGEEKGNESQKSASAPTKKKSSSSGTDRGKSEYWLDGARIGESLAKAIEKSIKDKDPPVTVKQFRESAQTTADNFQRELQKWKAQMARDKELGQEITDTHLEILSRFQDRYDGFMSKAGKYVR